MSDTVIDGLDYGPLAALVGVWKGDKGVDRAPEPDGEERNLFYESIMYEAIGDVTNAEKQTLSVLRYHQVVSRKSNDQVFHNETGYWSWDPATDVLMHSLTIPRGVCVLAGGKGVIDPETGKVEIDVRAKDGDPDWGVIQSPFMRDNARTTEFIHNIKIDGDEMQYSENTILDIYGRTYEHKDINRLTREK